MKVSTLRRKVQKLGSDLETLYQRLDAIIDDVEDDICRDMLEDIAGVLDSLVTGETSNNRSIPEVLDFIDQELNINDNDEEE